MYFHPEGPFKGNFLIDNSISFDKLKLTNSTPPNKSYLKLKVDLQAYSDYLTLNLSQCSNIDRKYI